MDTSTQSTQSTLSRLMVAGAKPTPRELAELGIDQVMLEEAFNIFTRKEPHILGRQPLTAAIGKQETPGDKRVVSLFSTETPVFPLQGKYPLRVCHGPYLSAVREGWALSIRLFLLPRESEFLVVPSAGTAMPFATDVSHVVERLQKLLHLPDEYYSERRDYKDTERGRRSVEVDSLALYLTEGIQRIYQTSQTEWLQGAGLARTAVGDMNTFLGRVAFPD